MNPSLARLRFVLWSALMLALCAVFFTGVKNRLAPETDILALLPAAEQDPVVDVALREFSEKAGRKTLFLVGAATDGAARTAASQFAQTLRGSAGFADVQLEVQSRMQ